jgi:cytochrome c553
MKTAKWLVPLMAVTLLVAVSARAMVESQLSDTRTASCLVKVTCDAAVLPLDTDTIENLLRSTSIGGKAAREVLGVPFVDNLLDVDPLYVGSAGEFGASAEPPGVPKPASEKEIYGELYGDEYMQMMGEVYTPLEAYTEQYGMMRQESKRPSTRTPSSSPRSRTASARRQPLDTYQAQNCSACHARSEMANAAARGCPIATGFPSLAAEQELLFRLEVDLREVVVGQAVKPAAEEFMNALVRNLDDALMRAFQDRTARLKEQIELAQSQCDKAQARLSKLMEQATAVSPSPAVKLDPADEAVYEQLNQIVDLSVLSPTMPFAEAIDILKNSAEPPLKIVVLWRDLLENAEIEPTTPINMDGISTVRLGTALELLLKAVAGGSEELDDYGVQNGVITVASRECLPRKLETRVYEVSGPFGVADELAAVIQGTIEPDTWLDYGGQGTINAYLGKKLSVRQTLLIHQRIQEFLQSIKIDIPMDIPADVSEEALLTDKHDLLRSKQRLEMDIARLEARRSAIEQQIAKINEQAAAKTSGDPVTVELQRLLETQTQQLANIKKLADAGRASTAGFADAEEKLARTRIELAKRREELGKAAGGDSLARLNSDLADMMIQLAEKKAELDVVSKQLKETENQLTMLAAVDPAISRIRMATQALELSEYRLSQLKTRLDNLQPPTVTVLGAAD